MPTVPYFIPLQGSFVADQGFAFKIDYPLDRRLHYFQILEDWKPLGPVTQRLDRIRLEGNGATAIVDDDRQTTVYFSTSDNSDPRHNGRRYQLGYLGYQTTQEGRYRDWVDVRSLDLDYYLERMRRRDYFSFVKRTHGTWELLLWYDKLQRGVATPRERNKVNRWQSKNITDILATLQNRTSDSFIEAVAFSAQPTTDWWWAMDDDLLDRIWLPYRLDQWTWHDAMIWKGAYEQGRFESFIALAREFPVVLVGPESLKPIGRSWNIPSFQHLPISRTDAYADTERVIAQLNQVDQSSLILFCAGWFAQIWIHHLHGFRDDCFLIDLGMVLEAYQDETADFPWLKKMASRRSLS